MAAITLWLLTVALLGQDPGTVVAADTRVQGRTYVFAETGKSIPYALFVPSNYDAAKPWPLIVALHGLGRPYDWMMGYDGMIDFAQRDGYLVVSPLGYHPRGWYGSRGPGLAGNNQPAAPAEPLPANLGELSEKDVMNVLGMARRDFNVDPDRIYLWGHSMGGAGTYYLASKHPGFWAGLAVAAPAPIGVESTQLAAFRHVPILVLHGDNDQTVPVAQTRQWVAKMKELGMEHVYIEVKGGDHSLFVSKNRDLLSKVFSFFNIVRRKGV
jgi:dipeptidyl aminopeptidase/acylaminoacyl peptidase